VEKNTEIRYNRKREHIFPLKKTDEKANIKMEREME